MPSDYLFEKIAFHSLAPAIAIVPIWIGVGRILVGGPVGWIAIMSCISVCPFLFVYHCALYGVLFYKNSSVSTYIDYSVSTRLANAIMIYYGLHFALQIFMNDTSYKSKSAAERWFCIPDVVAGVVSILLFLAIVGMMVVLMVFACIDVPVFLDSKELPILVNMTDP